MRLFLDNDIILKLSSIGMLQQIEQMFSAIPSSIYILGSAKYYIMNSSSLKKKYSKETIKNALTAIENYSVIPDEFLDENKLVELSKIESIDSGEQILYSLNVPDGEYLILTGDKRSLQQLSKYSPGICNSHTEKIVCLEKLFLKLLERFSFDDLSEKIITSDFCGDSVIKLCFSQNQLTIDKVKEGLNSYYSSLKSETGTLLFSG
ncbi:MAG: hypothetical protein B6D44_10220 [Ignavibacteriales bacterium UTCHB2]|nr:MAG: hypothetical protein B6D44_10220 [Ignavibacteriales bacterium UTCHB2]